MADNQIKLLVISHSIETEVINSNSFELTYAYVNATLPEISSNV